LAQPSADKIREIYRRLVRMYGRPKGWASDPISQLVGTILSQNTNDLNRDRAFDALRKRFPTWEAARDAPLGEVEEAIRVAGLWREKAARIQECLRRITEQRGSLTLDFLAGMPVPEAKAWLRSLPGVGPKTAAIVLLFSMGRPAFPVDTHIHRVATRLGLIPKVTREKAHELLEAKIPPRIYMTYHINLIEHGRKVCKPRPLCGICDLRDLCDFYDGLPRPRPGEPGNPVVRAPQVPRRSPPAG
jgi:endonuclease-3